MSTDPREFEHPIDGSHTPTPEAIEIQPWPEMFTALSIKADDGSELLAILSNGTVRGAIENAGSAAQRFVTELRGLTEAIAAQAKAEALREAAAIEPLDRVCTSCGAKRGNACYGNGPMRTPHPNRMLTQDWLRARAATIESEA